MGPKISTNNNEQYTKLLTQYQIIKNKTTDLLLLRKKGTNSQYLLKEYTYNDKKQFGNNLQSLNKKKIQYSANKNLLQIQRIFSQTNDQYCSTFYKIYVLFQWNTRTLDDEINQRNLHKKKMQEKDILAIANSAISALTHLQKQTIKHQNLSSQSILASPDGTYKLYDPQLISNQSNYDTLLAKRGTTHLYLSPQQTQSLQRQQNPTHYHPYKSDVWTLGMIIMQAGLLSYQDQCYRDQCSRIHYQTLQFNINRFKQTYSQSLGSLVQQMLIKQQKNRPDWSQITQKLNRQQGRSKYGSRISNGSLLKSYNDVNQQPFYRQSIARQSIKVMKSSQINGLQPIAISNINYTRPTKSIFPVPVYQTQTSFDQNLIAVNSESQIDITPNNKHNSSYFDSIPKPRTQQVNEVFNNPFASIKTNQIQQQNKSIQTNMFSPLNKIQGQQPNNFSGSKFQGEYVTERYRQGSQYTGYKVNGMRHGYGTFQYQDGGMYKGQWKFNKMQGNGSLFYQSGKVAYEGQWKNDQFSGRGVLYNQTPELLRQPFDYTDFDRIQQMWTVYQGEFKQDLKDGRGTLYLSNNEHFEGNFRADYVDGEGVFTSQNGNKIQGIWVLNKLTR